MHRRTSYSCPTVHSALQPARAQHLHVNATRSQLHVLQPPPTQRFCTAGEILIKQGDTGLAASELYIIQSGEFEILENRGGVNLRVNTKGPGEIFGEVALMYNSPRNATVAAIAKSRVFVLERVVFRAHVQETAETEGAQVELFLNSVPILQKLSAEERRRVAGALEEVAFEKGARVVQQGDPGDLFYIIKDGEAVVYQDTPRGTRLVNRLFKSDFFGEKALLQREPRMASVEAASTKLVCLALRRDVFTNLLGDLQEIMSREKSPQVRAPAPPLRGVLLRSVSAGIQCSAVQCSAVQCNAQCSSVLSSHRAMAPLIPVACSTVGASR